MNGLRRDVGAYARGQWGIHIGSHTTLTSSAGRCGDADAKRALGGARPERESAEQFLQDVSGVSARKVVIGAVDKSNRHVALPKRSRTALRPAFDVCGPTVAP
jgi:hypothetical protein